MGEKMMKIEISHNPYKTETIIKVNGKEIGESKFDEYLKERFQLWVDKISKLLVEEFNEDNFEVIFHGTELDYQDLKIELEKFEKSEDVRFYLRHEKAKEFGDKEKEIVQIYEKAAQLPFDELKSNALRDAYNKFFDEKLEINIVAPMSSGKSTLINSLVGKKILPSKNGPCTAIITKIEDDDDDTFKAVVLNKNNEEIGKYSNIDYTTMQELNENKEISEVNIKGNIPFVSSEDVKLVFIDTPGPNNAMNARHREVTHKALKNSSKMLVLFVMNGLSLHDDSQKEFLQNIAESMSVAGKQSKERFLFVVNKIDEYKVEDDDIKKDVIESTKKFLKEMGIENPNIFLVSADTALGIRRLKKATGEKKEDLIEEYESKIRKMNRKEQLHLEKYAKLPASSQKIIDKELEEAIKKEDVYGQALIHSGIRSLEEAIAVYVTKYTRPSKIANIVNALKHEFDSANAFANTEKKIASNKEEHEKYKREIKKLNEKISNGEESKKFKNKINELSDEGYKNFKKKLIDLIFEAGTEDLKTEFQLTYGDDELGEEEAKELIENFKNRTNTLQTEFAKSSEKLLENEIKAKGEKLVREYVEKLNNLSEDFSSNLELNLSSYVKREVNELENLSVIKIINEAEDTRIESHTETRSRTVIKKKSGWDRVFSPSAWLNPYYQATEYFEELIEKKIKFISRKKITDILVSELDENIYKSRDKILKFANCEIKKIKEFFFKKFDELDKILVKLTKKLENSIVSEENAKEALINAENLLKELKEIKDKLEKILEI